MMSFFILLGALVGVIACIIKGCSDATFEFRCYATKTNDKWEFKPLSDWDAEQWARAHTAAGKAVHVCEMKAKIRD